MKIRLSEWASQQGIAYVTAYRWARAGKVSGLHQATSGRLFVNVKSTNHDSKTVIYGRVSSHDQKEDLDRQMKRLRDYAAANGLTIDQEVSEMGSGLNGRRPRLDHILRNHDIGTIVVEHRDRLARFGVEYIEAALSASNRILIVINETEEKLDLIQDFVDVVTSMCSRIYGRQSAQNRAMRAVKAAESSS